MKIKFELTIEDLVAFSQYHANHSPAVRRARLIDLSIVLVPLVAIPPFLFPPQYRAFAWAGTILGAVLVSIGMPGRYARVIERQVRRLYGNGAFHETFGPWELELTATHLLKRSEANESSTRLSALGQVAVTDDYTFIYASPVTAFVIPRHSVIAGEFERFSEAVAQRVAAAR